MKRYNLLTDCESAQIEITTQDDETLGQAIDRLQGESSEAMQFFAEFRLENCHIEQLLDLSTLHLDQEGN